jgi:hypothetical protein
VLGGLFAGLLVPVPLLLLHWLADPSEQVGSLLLALALLAIAAPRLYLLGLRPLRRRVLLQPAGFTLLDGRHGQAFAFDRVARLYQVADFPALLGLPFARKRSLLVVMEDGRTVKLTPLVSQIERLTRAIREAVSDRLLREARARLRTCRGVDFGSLGVRPGGLVRGGRLLSWAQVGEPVVRGGWLSIRQKQDGAVWTREPVANVPNLDVLLELVRCNGDSSAEDETP